MGYTSGYFYTGNLISKEELYHHGILGQKWGIRRFQNLDGSLTAEGKKRYRYRSETIRQELGYGANARKKTNYAERRIIYQYRQAKQGRDVNLARAEKAKLKGKTAKAQRCRKLGKEFSDEMLKLKNVASKYRSFSPKERKKINSWVTRKMIMNVTMGELMAVGMAYVNPVGVGVGIVKEQDMTTFLDDYQRKHQK